MITRIFVTAVLFETARKGVIILEGLTRMFQKPHCPLAFSEITPPLPGADREVGMKQTGRN
jgi:hypothetical protein